MNDQELKDAWYDNFKDSYDNLLAEEVNQQEQDLNPPDNEEWNGVF